MFQLAAAWVLLLLPLPWLIRWLLKPVKYQAATALKHPSFESIKHIHHQQKSINRDSFIKLCCAFSIWCLLVFAASGPQWLGKPVYLPRSGRNLMLAIDLSGSMQIPDMNWHGHNINRLQVIKKLAGNFIQQRQGDRIGLILFGTRAYLQTPLTFDRKTVGSMLSDASIGLAGPQTAIGDAIGLAIKRLQQYPRHSRVLILLTDGQNNAGNVFPLKAAHIAAKLGIRIYTIGLGSDHVAIETFDGQQIVNPSADLDEKTLSKIAQLTGGKYFRAKDTQRLQAIYQAINHIEPITDKKMLLRPIKPLYPWPLALALILSLFLIISSRIFK